LIFRTIGSSQTPSKSLAQVSCLHSKKFPDGFKKMSPCGDSLLVISSLISDDWASLPFLFPVLGYFAPLT
jgi:hypothetical protein